MRVTTAPAPASLAEFLDTTLAPVLPGAVVSGLSRLKGGYSREMWSFDAVLPGGDQRPLILCMDTSYGVVGAGEQSLSRVTEAALLTALHAAGQPVPDVLCAGQVDSESDRQYLVMERGAGTAAVGPLLRDPWYVARREQLGADLATILASIHAVTLPHTLLGQRPDPSRVASRALALCRTELVATAAARSGVLDRSVEWLEQNPPPAPSVVTVVHGDFRVGNVLHGHDNPGARDGFRLVLDWEMAHYGDPTEDVAWAQLVCWRLGSGRVGGLVDPATWVNTYASTARRAVDQAALRWWEVLGSVKLACLLHRAMALTSRSERGLLERLRHELDAELARLLAVQGCT